MRLLLTTIIAGFVIAGPPQAKAQETDARAALAERLVDATLRDGLDKALQRVVDGQMADSPLPEAQTRWMSANMADILGPHLATMIDQTEALYAERLNIEQLTALVNFYDTPKGREIAALEFDLSAEVGAQMAPMMQAYLTELVTKFCAEFECPEQPTGQDAAKR